MAVTDALMKPGSFEVALDLAMPREVVTALDHFGHLVVTPARVDIRRVGDNVLPGARYTGVVRRRAVSDRVLTLGGSGLAVWLGDEDGKGPVIEPPYQATFSGDTFADVLDALLPRSIHRGILYSVPGTYSGSHLYQTPRQAIDYVCGVFNAEWRVNPDGTFDAGTEDQLFQTDPVAVVTRRDALDDFDLRALPAAAMELGGDAEDYSTRVVLIAEGQGTSVTTAARTTPVVPYNDLFGQEAIITRLISESGTATTNADARAQLHINRFARVAEAVRLTAQRYDIEGIVRPGDYVWVYDPSAGFEDLNHSLRHRGSIINPTAVRVTSISFPIEAGLGVYYRDRDGGWSDLTDYVRFETGDADFEVGGFRRTLTGTEENPTSRTNLPDIVADDGSVPAAPVLTTPFATQSYLDREGRTRAFISVAWAAPLNVDGSNVLDGDYFEIAFKLQGDFPWQFIIAGWDQTSATIYELASGVTYDIRVRAVDRFGNHGGWSATVTMQAQVDTIAPSTPAAPTVAGNPLSIMVTSTLGKSTGGTYNLENDLDRLEVYVGTTATFTADTTNLVGNIRAAASNLALQIPAIGNFPVIPATDAESRWVRLRAVDRGGNRSAQSAAATVTAVLIQDQHVANLNAAKITAGEIAAARIGAGTITGDKLEANTITTRQLMVGSFDNLIMNPGAEAGHLRPHSYSETFWYTNNSAYVRSGTYAYRCTEGAASQFFYCNGSPTNYTYQVSAFEGDAFYFEAWWRVDGPSNGAQISVRFCNRSGATLRTDSISNFASPTAYTKLAVGSNPAPQGTAYALFYLATLTGANRAAHFFDDLYARRMVGSAIIDNLAAEKIAAGTITARVKVVAGDPAATVELGSDLSSSTAFDGLSMHPHYNNCFMKDRQTGTVYFRVNRGGAHSIDFNTFSGQLIIKGDMTAGTITGVAFQTATTGARVVLDQTARERVKFYNSTGAETAGIGVAGSLMYLPAVDTLFVQSTNPIEFRVTNSNAPQDLHCRSVFGSGEFRGDIVSLNNQNNTTAPLISGSSAFSTATEIVNITGPANVRLRWLNNGRLWLYSTAVSHNLDFYIAGTLRLRLDFPDSTYYHTLWRNDYSGLKMLNSSAEVQSRLADDSNYAAFRGTAFNVQSVRESKTAIAAGGSAAALVAGTPVYRYQHVTDPPGRTKRWGLMAEELPDGLRDGDGVDLYAMTSMLWRAVQELTEQKGDR